MEKSNLDQLIKQWKTQLVSSGRQDENPAGFIELFEEEVFGGVGLSEYTNGTATQCTSCDTITNVTFSCCGVS